MKEKNTSLCLRADRKTPTPTLNAQPAWRHVPYKGATVTDDDPKRPTESAEDYRRKAKEALEMVERSKSVAERERYLRIATEWLQLAEEIEQGLFR